MIMSCLPRYGRAGTMQRRRGREHRPSEQQAAVVVLDGAINTEDPGSPRGRCQGLLYSTVTGSARRRQIDRYIGCDGEEG